MAAVTLPAITCKKCNDQRPVSSPKGSQHQRRTSNVQDQGTPEAAVCTQCDSGSPYSMKDVENLIFDRSSLDRFRLVEYVCEKKCATRMVAHLRNDQAEYYKGEKGIGMGRWLQNLEMKCENSIRYHQKES